MIGKKMLDAINAQINAEFYSSYLYMSMSSYFSSIGMPGAANWMRIQALEEMTHAEKFCNYIDERGGRVILTAIEGPETQWEDALAAFEAVLAHEQKVTSLINNLMDVAISEKDHAATLFLQWFVGEQVEEEASAQAVIDQLKLAGESKGGMLMIDRELGQRVFNPPVA
ncbi:MAG: ferritin [Sedimentisphaeraceae bacterium JB056]